MQRRGRVALFAVAAVVWSLLLAVAMWKAPHGTQDPARYLVTVAAAGTMLAAQGASWGKRLAYAAAVMGAFVAFDFVCTAMGLAEAAALRGPTSFEATTLVTAYYTVGMALPVAALVVFVGKNPAMLWTPRT